MTPGPDRPCDFCASPAVAVFSLPGGCVARPGAQSQALCEHHARKARPLAGMALALDLTRGGAFTRSWERP
jgi:hypothetical protein